MLPPSVRVQSLPIPTVIQPIHFTRTGVGTVTIYTAPIPETEDLYTINTYINTSYYVICLALNILLTLMIITKLILHRKNLQHAIGAPNAITRVYTTIVIMLVESYALYAVALLSDIVTWALQSVGLYITTKILCSVQVCAFVHFPNTQAWSDIPPHR